MYDLETLQYLNEQAVQAHLRSVARANESPEGNNLAVSPPAEPVLPLATLAYLLLSGPPSLACLLELFENSDLVNYFFDLVREYLPRYEAEIRSATMDERVRLFFRYFEQNYFPLNYDMIAGSENELEEFLREIPVELRGFTYEDYHEFMDFRTGYILMLSLIESPGGDVGERIPILTHIADLFGRDVAALVPKEGWSPAHIHQRTDGTRFDGVGVFADWVHSQTDCWMLDANYYDYQGEQWHPGVVDGLAEQWPRVCEIERKILEVSKFIEVDPRKRFLELLDLLLDEDTDTQTFIVPDEQLPLPLFEDSGERR